MKTFLISDTHFGHKNILRYEPDLRPFASVEEMNETLIENWNSVVGKNDICWHLGDVLFGAKAFELLSRLNGCKKLVMGNHDIYPIERYAEHFQKIVPYDTLAGCILSHIPVHTGQVGEGRRFKLNIHGHLHSKNVMEHIPGIGLQDDARYRNVSVEQTGLKPMLLDEVING